MKLLEMDDEITNKFISLSFCNNFPQTITENLLKLAQVVEKSKGSVISRQYEQSHSFYFLLRGKVGFAIRVNSGTEEFLVGESDLEYTPIGWSGFHAPHRYATTITCVDNCLLIKWSFTDLMKYFEEEPEYGSEFIRFILKNALNLLSQVRTKLTRFNNTHWDVDFSQKVQSTVSKEDIAVQDALSLLKTSPFFEIFHEDALQELSYIAQKRIYFKGESIFKQGEAADGIDLLVSGNVAYCFNPEGLISELDPEKLLESKVLRMIHYPGYVIGWIGCINNTKNDVTAIATRTTVIYHFSREEINRVFNKDSKLALQFSNRLLQLVSILLRNARTRLISEQFEREITAIKTLVEQNSTQLSVESNLHKLPYLLNDANTLEDAFTILFSVEVSGNTFEKSIAKLSLDILSKIYIECKFYSGLKKAYQSVVEAPSSFSVENMRIKSAQDFMGLFQQTDFVIKGWEYLPDEPGNIFIYNHLVNHRYYTLPNNFQMTLDSSFIKSMILYRKYNKPGIAVVRVPKAVEYAHQNYYKRLGHIYVYTKHSELSEQYQKEHKEFNKQFYRNATEYLQNGENLMISPEGRSYRTKESPGEFKAGAFRLAAGMDPEPLIVPLAMANFDKRVKNNVFSVVIKKPFKISDLVADPLTNKEGLNRFLEDYRKTYSGYVKEALDIAKKEASEKINLKELIPVNKVA